MRGSAPFTTHQTSKKSIATHKFKSSKASFLFRYSPTPDFKVFTDDHAQRQVCDGFKDYRATLYGDSGFQGIGELGLPLEVRLNERARRNHPLTREQKKINRLRSATRIEIEHTFSRRKKYGIAAEVYRNRDEDYDATMNVVAGLVNLRAYERIFQRTGLQL